DAIFSKARKRRFPHDLTTWGQLGLKGQWAGKPISLYGRNSASGTYGFFKDHGLGGGDFKDAVKEQPGSASVVQGVTEDLYGIGYSGIGYRTSGVKALALAETVGGPSWTPTYENAVSGKYPLARYLYIYVVRDPRRPMDPLTKEFLRYVLSQEGQRVVIKDGYLPLPAALVAEELAKLD
ncbi:MAG: substrate-binding domain-containing protein, partial [Thermoanaerobaculaceae bacterium]|nr:substrate-binding domain-containing protein [Thermoanaerobaculaceae bacterium]